MGVYRSIKALRFIVSLQLLLRASFHTTFTTSTGNGCSTNITNLLLLLIIGLLIHFYIDIT